MLARRFGFAADHVRSVDLVTADGRLRHVTAGADPDLFWALRGAGANFGVATALEIDLFPVATLLGGELPFPPDACGEVLAAYAAEWSREVPETIASSVLLGPDPALGSGLITQMFGSLTAARTTPRVTTGWTSCAKCPRLVDSVWVMP